MRDTRPTVKVQHKAKNRPAANWRTSTGKRTQAAKVRTYWLQEELSRPAGK
jgi:hypothetical protein